MTRHLSRSLAVALPLLVLCSCAMAGSAEQPSGPGGSSPPPVGGSAQPSTPAPAGSQELPEPVQLAPEMSRPSLSASQANQVVATAAADREVAAALAQGRVATVQVRATTTGRPSDAPAAVVAFVFAQPVDPADPVWTQTCDIAGQTRQWRGVAARVELRTRNVISSPIWLTGANCVGLRLAAA